jgi:hypothetical protein
MLDESKENGQKQLEGIQNEFNEYRTKIQEIKYK